MSVILNQEMPGLEDASARLSELEASNNEQPAARATQQEQREPAAKVDGGSGPAAAPGKEQTQKPADQQTDTLAATGKEPEAGKSKDNLEAGKGGEADRSKYAKAQERLEKTWEGVNKRKGDLDTKEQQLTQRERQLQEREEQISRQAEESQAQYKPEDVDRAAAQKLDRAKALNERADGLEAKAKKLEDDGNYKEAAKASDEAKSLRKKANQEEGNAEDLKTHAEHLRKNPPASLKQREEKTEVARKEWTTKAALDFPELAKQGSDLQKKVAEHLNALWNSDRVLGSHPQIIYHVTRMAAAETAAARVPGLEKQLGELKAKVQDYEKLTAVAAPGAAQRPDVKTTKTDEEERAELSELASSVGSIR